MPRPRARTESSHDCYAQGSDGFGALEDYYIAIYGTPSTSSSAPSPRRSRSNGATVEPVEAESTAIFGIMSALTAQRRSSVEIRHLARGHRLRRRPLAHPCPGRARPPQRADADVESLIALSIVVSGAHALRPIVRGGEVWITAGFG